jgi:hypothetical protein
MKNVVSRQMTKIGVIFGSVVCLMSLIPFSMGNLSRAAGISIGDAASFIAILMSAGAITAEALEPWLIPFVGTVQGLIFLVGVAAAAGW